MGMHVFFVVSNYDSVVGIHVRQEDTKFHVGECLSQPNVATSTKDWEESLGIDEPIGGPPRDDQAAGNRWILNSKEA